MYVLDEQQAKRLKDLGYNHEVKGGWKNGRYYRHLTVRNELDEADGYVAAPCFACFLDWFNETCTGIKAEFSIKDNDIEAAVIERLQFIVDTCLSVAEFYKKSATPALILDADLAQFNKRADGVRTRFAAVYTAPKTYGGFLWRAFDQIKGAYNLGGDFPWAAIANKQVEAQKSAKENTAAAGAEKSEAANAPAAKGEASNAPAGERYPTGGPDYWHPYLLRPRPAPIELLEKLTYKELVNIPNMDVYQKHLLVSIKNCYSMDDLAVIANVNGFLKSWPEFMYRSRIEYSEFLALAALRNNDAANASKFVGVYVGSPEYMEKMAAISFIDAMETDAAGPYKDSIKNSLLSGCTIEDYKSMAKAWGFTPLWAQRMYDESTAYFSVQRLLKEGESYYSALVRLDSLIGGLPSLKDLPAGNHFDIPGSVKATGADQK